MRLSFVVIVAGVLGSPVVAQNQWHVEAGACDGARNGTADAPFCTIQEAVDAAQSGDTVLVRPGVYVEDVQIPALRLTLTAGAGPGRPEIESAAQASLWLAPGSDLVLEGFTLTRAGIRSNQARVALRDCHFIGVHQYMGGGIWAEDSDLSLSDCRFEGATGFAGGAIAASGGTLRLKDCAFSGRVGYGVTFLAGALMLEDIVATIDGCAFVDYGVAHSGAAIRIQGGYLELTGSAFVDNFVFDYAGAVALYDAAASIRECTFAYNASCFGWGGALYVNNQAGLEVLVEDCLFEKNSAAEGGAVCVHAGSIVLERCRFLGNSAATRAYSEHGHGGALIVGGLGPPGAGVGRATRCEFVGNSARGHANLGDGRGGAVHGPVQLESCTLFDNQVSGLFGDGPVGGGAAGGATLHNCIVWRNRILAPRQIHRSTGATSPDRTASAVQLEPGTVADWCVVEGGWPGEGNLAVDPRFTRPEQGDLHLRESSPCIDRGDPRDLDEDGSRIDIGAHAFSPRHAEGDSGKR